MAEEEPEEGAEEEPHPVVSTGRYIFLIVMILVLEGVGGYILLDQAVPVPEESTKKEEAQPEEEDEEKTLRFYTDLEEMMVHPVSTRGRHLLQVSLALEVDTELVLGEIAKKRELIWDLILQKLETYSVKALRDPAKMEVKKALKQVINKEAKLKNGEVIAIYFTDVVLQ